MKYILSFSFLLLVCLPAKADLAKRISVGGTYVTRKAGLESGETANSSGFGPAVGFELRTDDESYRLGVTLGAQRATLKNSANSGTRTEETKSQLISAGARLYALNVFLGGQLVFGDETVTTTSSGVASESKLGAFGYQIDLGFDKKLSKSFFVTPFASYRRLKLDSRSSASTFDSSDIAANVLVGFQF